MCEKDYNLLRPFDLEAAKRGEKLVRITAGALTDVVLAALGGPDGDHAVRKDDGDLIWGKAENLRMAPLCWVEGRPVYKGDVLYGTKCREFRYNVIGFTEDGLIESAANENGNAYEYPCRLTWTPPKVKREGWLNIYPGGYVGTAARPTREMADDDAAANRITCIRIEWEE